MQVIFVTHRYEKGRGCEGLNTIALRCNAHEKLTQAKLSFFGISQIGRNFQDPFLTSIVIILQKFCGVTMTRGSISKNWIFRDIGL